jgi:ABC-2 type transport system permease protein
MKKVLLIGWKDLKLAFRDRSALLLMLAAPFLLTAGMGFITGRLSGGSGGIQGIPVVVVNQDGGQLGDSLANVFQSAELAELVSPTILEDAAAARALIDADKAAAAVIIPAGFTDSVIPATGSFETGPAVQIELYANPSSPTSAGVIQTIVDHFLGDVEVGRISGVVAVTQLLRSGRIQPQDAARVGESIGAAQATSSTPRASVKTSTNDGAEIEFDPLALMAPSMALMFLMVGAVNGGRSLLAERNLGTLPRLLVAPVGFSQVLAGKTIGTFFTCAAQMLILISASALLFGLRWGDWVGVLAISLAAALAATAWGMLIAGLARTPGQVMSVGSAITLLFGILGGAFINRDAMPPWFQVASKITPNAWGLEGFTTLALGGSLADVLLPVGALLVMAAVVFGAALVAIRTSGKGIVQP